MGFLRLNFTFNIFLFKKFVKWKSSSFVQNLLSRKIRIDCVQNVVIQKKKFLLIYKITLQINLTYVYICHIYAFGFVFISRIIW